MPTFKELMEQDPFTYVTSGPFLATIETHKNDDVSKYKDFMKSLVVAYAEEEEYSPEMDLQTFLNENYSKSTVMTLAGHYAGIGIDKNAQNYMSNRAGVLGIESIDADPPKVIIPTLSKFVDAILLKLVS